MNRKSSFLRSIGGVAFPALFAIFLAGMTACSGDIFKSLTGSRWSISWPRP